jgi:hypothetical protein
MIFPYHVIFYNPLLQIMLIVILLTKNNGSPKIAPPLPSPVVYLMTTDSKFNNLASGKGVGDCNELASMDPEII